MSNELLKMTTALGTVLIELGRILDRGNVLPMTDYAAVLSRIALNAEQEGDDHARYLAVWAFQVVQAAGEEIGTRLDS